MRGFPTVGFRLHRQARDMAVSWMAGVGGWEAWKETVLLSCSESKLPRDTERVPCAPLRSVISVIQVKHARLAGWFPFAVFSWLGGQMAESGNVPTADCEGHGL